MSEFKQFVLIGAALVLAAVAGGNGYLEYRAGRTGSPGTARSTAADRARPVPPALPDPQILDGKIEASGSADVRSRISGTVKTVYVSRGTTVNEGDTLVELE